MLKSNTNTKAKSTSTSNKGCHYREPSQKYSCPLRGSSPHTHTKQPHPLLKMKDTLQILRQQNMLHDDCINLPPHQALFVFVWGKPPMQPCMRCSPEVDDNASYSPMLTKEDSKNINVVIKKPSKLGLL